MSIRTKKPEFVSFGISELASEVLRKVPYEERGKWLTDFLETLLYGTENVEAPNEFAVKMLNEARSRMDKKAEDIRAYREKKKAEEEDRKAEEDERRAARSAARKSKEVAEEPRQDVKAFGSANNVFLSNDEIDRLKEYEYSGVRIGRQDILDIIEELSAWKAKGNKTKSDYATILSWFQRRVKEKRDKGASKQKTFQQMQHEYQDELMADVYTLRGIT